MLPHDIRRLWTSCFVYISAVLFYGILVAYAMMAAQRGAESAERCLPAIVRGCSVALLSNCPTVPEIRLLAYRRMGVVGPQPVAPVSVVPNHKCPFMCPAPSVFLIHWPHTFQDRYVFIWLAPPLLVRDHQSRARCDYAFVRQSTQLLLFGDRGCSLHGLLCPPYFQLYDVSHPRGAQLGSAYMCL